MFQYSCSEYLPFHVENLNVTQSTNMVILLHTVLGYWIQKLSKDSHQIWSNKFSYSSIWVIVYILWMFQKFHISHWKRVDSWSTSLTYPYPLFLLILPINPCISSCLSKLISRMFYITIYVLNNLSLGVLPFPNVEEST